MSLPNPLTRIAVQGSVGIAYAVRSYQRGGAQYADVVYPGIGFWEACPVVGDRNKAIKAPVGVFSGHLDPAKHPQVVIAFREAKLPPIVMDLVSNPDISLSDSEEEDEYHARDEKDPDGTVQTTDTVFSNGGSLLAIRSTGAVDVVPNKQVSFALGDYPLRISKDGDSSDNIPGASTLADKLNNLADAVNAVSIRLKVVETVLTVGLSDLFSAISAVLPPGFNPMSLSTQALNELQGQVAEMAPAGKSATNLAREVTRPPSGPSSLVEFAGLVDSPELELRVVDPTSGDLLAAPGITIPSKGV